MKNQFLKSIGLLFVLIFFGGCKKSDFTITSPMTGEKSAEQKFDHNNFLTVSCVECHEKVRPISTPAHGDNRVCNECHTANKMNNIQSWKNVIKFNHQSFDKEIMTCAKCHQSKMPTNKAPHLKNQIATKNDCVLCHNPEGWKKQKFNHNNKNVTNCMQCHTVKKHKSDGTFLDTPHPVKGFENVDCIYCHQGNEPSKSWKDLIFDYKNHSPTPTNCNNCHENQRTESHKNNPSTLGMDKGDCFLCHGSTTDWKLNLKKFNHDQAAPKECMACHQKDTPKNEVAHPSKNGNYKKMDCILCHSYKQDDIGKKKWSQLTFDQRNHFPPPQTCNLCHQEINDSRPLNNSHQKLSRANRDCQTCHQFDSKLNWKNFSKFKHNMIQLGESCESCHTFNSQSLKFKTKEHLETNLACNECHKTEGWKPATFKHTALDSNCLKCHNGKAAMDQPNSHTLTVKVNCTACHVQNDWKEIHYDINFNHSVTSKMNLVSKKKNYLNHKKLNECSTCHEAKSDSVKYKFNFGKSCASCHADAARKIFGHVAEGINRLKNCEECHGFDTWRRD